MRARGVVKIGEVKARWVHGYHVRVKGRHYIYSETRERLSVWDFTEIYPLSLALETGRTDRRGKAIFGSYPVDGKMSKGGDRVRKPGFPRTGTNMMLSLVMAVFTSRITGNLLTSGVIAKSSVASGRPSYETNP